MKIKLDENLPHALCDEFVSFGHDADTVDDEGLAGEPDEPFTVKIASYAFLISLSLMEWL
jgi:hypothetical protein